MTDGTEIYQRTCAGKKGYGTEYFARKYGLTRKQARDLINHIGDDRVELCKAAETLRPPKQQQQRLPALRELLHESAGAPISV